MKVLLFTVMIIERMKNRSTVFSFLECLKNLLENDELSVDDGSECKKTIARRVELGSADLSLDPLLKSACAMDLTKVSLISSLSIFVTSSLANDFLLQFCVDVPVTGAQQTECLADVFHEQSSQRKLRPRCEKLVKERIGMLSVAVKQVPLPEGLKGE